ncbi:MAG: histidine kinase, partial [Thermoanaerobaculia bacterium]
FLEHAFWVVFEDAILIWGIGAVLADMKTFARQQADLEHVTEQEQLKTAALEMALSEFEAARAAGTRSA